MKKSLFILIICFIFSFTGCIFNTDDPGNNGGSKASISKEYWGAWIQMDTGTEYYIDGSCIYESSSSSKKYYKVQDGISGYSLESENILKKGNLRFFRKGGASRDFSIQISGFADNYSRSASARAASSGKQGIKGRRENRNNSSDTETSTSDEQGKTSFTDAVADDPQTITIEDVSSTTVIPEYDGQDMGTIPIVEKGMYGFKTTYSIDSDAQGFCYGNLIKTYTLTLKLNNIGDVTCSTSVYSISCEDPNLTFLSGNLSGNFSSIEPKKSKRLTFSINYSYLDKEYIDVPIKISITDSKYLRTWNDTVTLRFYKGKVSFKINSRNFDSNSSATLNGFFIYPDGRSKRFTVSAGKITTVTIPWSEKNYILAFSGATANNEMAYSFGFAKTTSLADISGLWSINDINAYESNNTVSSAYKINDLSTPIKAYLYDGDIDFYIINNSKIEVGFEPTSMISYAVKEFANGNDDGIVTPGESHYLDVKFRNETESELKGVSLKLSTTSSYVNLIRNSYVKGDLIVGNYYSLTDEDTSVDRCLLMHSNYSSNAFKFSVSKDCPDGELLPFTITFTDSDGHIWIDSITVPVSTTKANIALITGKNYAVKEYANGNDDGLVTPGESHYLDVKFSNIGASTALGVTVSLSTTSSYVTLIRNSYVKGDLIVGNYYSLTDQDTSVDRCYLMYNNYYSSNAFKFSVSDKCPNGKVLPFTVTFTDSDGHVWTDTFTVPVV